MKIIIPGGSGDVGALLSRYFEERGDEVVILSRNANAALPHGRVVRWDGKTMGPWTEELDGADVVVNLAGRTVNCRYSDENLRQMMDSRIDSTKVVGEAIAAVEEPPKTWLQMSTATIYAHRFDAPNDERTGIIGGEEEGVPDYWAYSVEIAKRWEAAQIEAVTPETRKVALRAAMVMSPTPPDGIFGTLLGLVKKGLGGTVAGGEQYVSWVHEDDFARAIQFLIDQEHIEGPVNIAAPNPLPQKEHMALLREATGVSLGLPAAKWMTKIGAFFMRTDTELILKSRRVIPGRLADEGFEFEFPQWGAASRALVEELQEDSI